MQDVMAQPLVLRQLVEGFVGLEKAFPQCTDVAEPKRSRCQLMIAT